MTYLYNHLGCDSIALEAGNEVGNLNAGYGWGKNGHLSGRYLRKATGSAITQ